MISAIFNSASGNLSFRNGEEVTVLRSLTIDTVTMYRIRFSDGDRTDAYADELFFDGSSEETMKSEFAVRLEFDGLIEQRDSCAKRGVMWDRLNERALALAWVMGRGPNLPLTLNDEVLEALRSET